MIRLISLEIPTLKTNLEMIFHNSDFSSPDTGVSTEMNFMSRNTIHFVQASQLAPGALSGITIDVSQ